MVQYVGSPPCCLKRHGQKFLEWMFMLLLAVAIMALMLLQVKCYAIYSRGIYWEASKMQHSLGTRL